MHTSIQQPSGESHCINISSSQLSRRGLAHSRSLGQIDTQEYPLNNEMHRSYSGTLFPKLLRSNNLQIESSTLSAESVAGDRFAMVAPNLTTAVHMESIEAASLPDHSVEPDELSMYTVDFQKMSDTQALLELVEERLARDGIVVINNYPIPDMSKFSDLAQRVIARPMSYIGGTNSREDLGGGALSVGTEPPFVDVAAHNEMSYYHSYPERIMFGCMSCPPGRGFTMVADNRVITDAVLATETGQTLWREGVTYVRNFHDARRESSENGSSSSEAIGSTLLRSWQETFGTSDEEEMNALCDRMGWQSCFSDKGTLKISYTLPAFEYDPTLNRPLLFASIGNHALAFDQWPPFNALPSFERPYHMTFGNGEPFSSADLDTITRLFKEHELPVRWTPDKVAILDNRRFTHARPPFKLEPSESRRLGVHLGNEQHRFGQRNVWHGSN